MMASGEGTRSLIQRTSISVRKSYRSTGQGSAVPQEESYGDSPQMAFCNYGNGDGDDDFLVDREEGQDEE